jgi:hypothetical protein
MTLRLLLGAILLTDHAAAAAATAPRPFLREDWVYVNDVKAPDKFGVNHWGLESFPLFFRVVQRGKHAAETRYADNFRSDGSRARRIGGGALRGLSTMLDFALFTGLQNFDHVLAHDSRGREFARDYPGSVDFVARRFTATLPVLLGGKELSTSEKSVVFRAGVDIKTLENSTIWEMRNQFVYDLERKALAREEVNATTLSNLVFHRLNLLQLQWEEPSPVCVAAYGQTNQPGVCRAGSGSARDYSNYLMDLNTGRYGAASRDDYKVKLGDLKRATMLHFLDPIFLLSAYRYGADYIGAGENVSRLPMIPLGGGLSYLPGLRVDLSPFGIEYIQDNFLRYRGTLTNLFWTRGDNRYERRLGAGFDVTGLPLYGGVTFGLLGQLYKQPLSRVDNNAALTPAEVGRLHNVWNAAVSLRAPLLSFGPDRDDPRQVLLTLKVGRKNTGWMPGEYIRGAAYVDVGLGMRL